MSGASAGGNERPPSSHDPSEKGWWSRLGETRIGRSRVGRGIQSMGLVAFLFFLIKGLLWLIVPLLISWGWFAR